MLLSRIISTQAGQDSVHVGLRDAYNKLIHPGKWQTFSGYVLKGSKSGKPHIHMLYPTLQNINEEEGGADRVWPPGSWVTTAVGVMGIGERKGLACLQVLGVGDRVWPPGSWVTTAVGVMGIGSRKRLAYSQVLGWGTGCGHQGAGSPQLWVSNDLGNHAGLRIHKCPPP